VHWDFWLAVTTLALAAFTAWLALETRLLRMDAAKSSEASKQSIILSHRPKLIVRSVITDGDPMGSSHDISGNIQVFNAGNTIAHVFVVTCEVWIGENLPMRFHTTLPEGKNPNNRSLTSFPVAI
jgi:hypothetical protein